MSSLDRADDAALLRAEQPEAFGTFYRRHLPWVLRWLVAHVHDRELAADLAGEVFASALSARASFDATFGTPSPGSRRSRVTC